MLAPEDEYDRCEKEHRGIVEQHAIPGAFLLHLPNVVEGRLDVVDERHHTVEHHQDAYAYHHARFGMVEVRVGELDDPVYHLRLTRQRLVQPLFDISGQTESLGNGKDSRHHGDNGKQGAETE